MTMYSGMLLFDVAEESIGKWKNQVGFRGMMEVWRKAGTEEEIIIQSDEDRVGNTWEVIWQNNESGAWNYIGFGTFNQCDRIAKQYMRKEATHA